MTKYEYNFITDVHVKDVFEPDDNGFVRVNKTLNHFAQDGWRVIRFEHGDFGLHFWALLEREVHHVGE